MSKIECSHVKYCCDCDRYYCSSCVCACKRNEIADAIANRQLVPEKSAEILKIQKIEQGWDDDDDWFKDIKD